MASFAYDLPISNSLSSTSAVYPRVAVPSLPPPKAPSNNVVPNLIREHWYEIGRSGLPAQVFNDLVRFAEPRPNDPRRGGLSRTALREFLDFWGAIGAAKAEPVVSGTSDGYLVAEWVQSADNSLVLMFDVLGNVHFSLFMDGLPLEGVRSGSHRDEVLSLLNVGNGNPFGWSDAVVHD